MMTPDRIAIVVGAALALLLQIALAPYIAIGYAMPNFVAVFAVIVAVEGSVSQAPPVKPEAGSIPVGTVAGEDPLATTSVLSSVVPSAQVPFTTL